MNDDELNVPNLLSNIPLPQNLIPMKPNMVQYSQQKEMPLTIHRCANCAHFKTPSSCMVVEGGIDANAWCLLWVGLPALKKPSPPNLR